MHSTHSAKTNYVPLCFQVQVGNARFSVRPTPPLTPKLFFAVVDDDAFTPTAKLFPPTLMISLFFSYFFPFSFFYLMPVNDTSVIGAGWGELLNMEEKVQWRIIDFCFGIKTQRECNDDFILFYSVFSNVIVWRFFKKCKY